MEIQEKSYDSVLAANYLLALAYEKDIVLNVTKVQKLLYMAYGYFLANKGFKIFQEEPKAWPYGPVFPRTRKKVDYSKVLKVDSNEFDEIKSDGDLTSLFNKLIDKYSRYTASQLTEWSHVEGGPWYLATKQEDFNWNSAIPDQLIRTYFSKIKI